MTYSPFTATGDGSTTAYSIAFDYINTSDVKATVNNVATTAFTVSGSTVTFTTAPPSGQAIKIFRSTDNVTIQSDFQSGSALRAVDLNDNFTQLLYVTQESTDTSDEANTDAAAAVVTANAASTAATNAVNTANAASTAATSATNTANAASTAATNATNTANTAATDASNAVSTANTAASDASSAVSTANTASTNASNAVTTANTASTNATAAVNSANTAVSTANTASTNATNAVATANAASANATTALNNSRESDGAGGFNTAIDKANTAVTTANTASTNASTAVSTANTASSNASTAVSTANTANATANAAAATVASAVFYTPVANFASFPSSPSNQDRIEVTDSTGLESQSIITGIPSGFTGSSDLTMRLEYNSSTSKWEFKQYFAEDPEARYMPKQGGTMTGLLTLSGAPTANLHAATKAYVDSANATQDSTISTNTSNISTNTSNISTNTSNISTNTSNISTNTSNISTNATAIATKMATAGGTFTGAVSFDDNVIVKGDSTNGSGELTLNCENNSHGIKIKGPPHSAGANYTLTLPNDTGTNGQSLQTNGSGVLSFGDVDLSSRLPLTGGTLTGALTLYGAPTANLHAATKAYVDTEVAGLVDSAPGTLDTLNELAAALGDDANFSTTVTNSIATKMPLAGGTFTGNVTLNADLDMQDSDRILMGTGDDLRLFHDSANSYVENYNGSIILKNYSDDADILLSTDNGSGGTTNYIKCDGSNGEVVLYHYGSTKLYTKSDGVDITGELQSNTLDCNGAANIAGDLIVDGTGRGTGNVYTISATKNDGTNGLLMNTSGELWVRDKVKIGTSTSSPSISLNNNGSASFNGTVTLHNNLDLQDNDYIKLGTGDDFELYFDATYARMQSGSNTMLIRSNQIELGDAGGNKYIKCVDGAQTELYHNGVKTFETSGSGINVKGPENGETNLEIHADEGDDNVDKFRFNVSNGGPMRIQNVASGGWETNIECNGNGNVELYHNNSKKFETTSGGASVTGTLTASGVMTAQAGAVAEIDTLSSASTITPNFANSCNFTVTLGTNTTIANPSNLTAGQSGSIFIVQDGTGSRTASWGTYWDWAGGAAPTLTTSANGVDRIDYIVRSSTSIHAVATLAYS